MLHGGAVALVVLVALAVLVVRVLVEEEVAEAEAGDFVTSPSTGFVMSTSQQKIHSV